MTDTTGKFKVNYDNTEYGLVFKNAAGEKTYYDRSGYITLPAGVYTVSIDRDPFLIDYYVDPEGIEVPVGTRPANAGTKENPVRTVADATRLISQDGLTKIDIAVVHLKDDTTNYWVNENTSDATYNVAPSNYSCTLIIDSTMPGSVTDLSATKTVTLSGDTVFRNINCAFGGTDTNGLILNGHNFTLEETASLSTSYVFAWKKEKGKLQTNDMTVIIKGVLQTGYIHLSSTYHNHTSTGDFNFYIDNPESVAPFFFGPKKEASGPNVYNGNINITVRQAQNLGLLIPQTANGGAIFNGSLHVLVDDSVLLPYATKANFENFETTSDKWFIINEATDDDFVTFTDKGILSVKNGANAYSRQLDKDQVAHAGGTIDFSQAPGIYTVSNKAIAPIAPEDPHRMLYFYTGAISRTLATRAKIIPGETYIFEYTIYTNKYEDCSPRISKDGYITASICEIEMISETKIGDCYKIVCKGTIPESYDKPNAYFGVKFISYSEGILFDRTVYKENDPTKTDCFEGNQNFHNGLDRVALDSTFWGGVKLDSCGLVKWQSGLEHLEVMPYDLSKVEEIKILNNPNDGKWWDKDDIKKEVVSTGYATIKGTFMYKDGTPIKGQKMLLVGDSKSYYDTTDKNGKFEYKKIPTGYYELYVVDGENKVATGYYELYVVDGENKVATGFGSYVFDGEVVEFNVINDTTGYVIDSNTSDGFDSESESESENIVEIVPGGTFTGTVYTPNREIVPGLKVVLKGFGEVVTDENGRFGFANIPIGEYELYAINSDGSEYLFNKYIIRENSNWDVKLKYDPPLSSNSDGADGGWIIWVIVASVVALVVVGALAFYIILKKKKGEQV